MAAHNCEVSFLDRSAFELFGNPSGRFARFGEKKNPRRRTIQTMHGMKMLADLTLDDLHAVGFFLIKARLVHQKAAGLVNGDPVRSLPDDLDLLRGLGNADQHRLARGNRERLEFHDIKEAAVGELERWNDGQTEERQLKERVGEFAADRGARFLKLKQFRGELRGIFR